MVMTFNIRAKTDQNDNDRCINNLDQELPLPSECESFLKKGSNRLQLVNLLADLIKDRAVGEEYIIHMYPYIFILFI